MRAKGGDTRTFRERREEPDHPRQQYISALAEGAQAEGVVARQVAAEIEGLMLHVPKNAPKGK